MPGQLPSLFGRRRRGLDAAGVAASLLFGQRPRAKPFAARQRRNASSLLRFGTEGQDVPQTKRIVRRDVERQGRAVLRQFHNDLGVSDEAHPQAAKLRRSHESHQPQLAGLGEDRARQLFLPLPLLATRVHFRAAEVRRLLQNHPLARSARLIQPPRWGIDIHSKLTN